VASRKSIWCSAPSRTGQLDRFEALLGVPDWRIYDWLTGAKATPLEFDNDVFHLLRDYRKNLTWNG